jgi:hypothetical protein
MKRTCPKCGLSVEVEPGTHPRTYACPDCSGPIAVPGIPDARGVQGAKGSVLSLEERTAVASERAAKALVEIRNLIAGLMILGLIWGLVSLLAEQ